MRFEVAVRGAPVPNKPTVSVDVKQHSATGLLSLWIVLDESTAAHPLEQYATQ